VSEPKRPVVAAVIQRGGRYLVGRRPKLKRHGGLWEFPGGKIDDGEDTEAAARRELQEELALEVTGIGPLLHAVEDVGSAFVIHFHAVSVDGQAHAREHDHVGWFSLDELREMELAPADRQFVAWLTSRAGA